MLNFPAVICNLFFYLWNAENDLILACYYSLLRLEWIFILVTEKYIFKHFISKYLLNIFIEDISSYTVDRVCSQPLSSKIIT